MWGIEGISADRARRDAPVCLGHSPRLGRTRLASSSMVSRSNISTSNHPVVTILLSPPGEAVRMDAFHATMAWDDATIADQSTRARRYVDQLRWGGEILPIVVGALGAVIFTVGTVLLIRRSGRA